MLNVMIVGMGKMGKLVMDTIAKKDDMQTTHMYDGFTTPDLSDVHDVDVIIDFSHPNNLKWLAPYIKMNHVAYVCGTTGHNEEEKQIVQSLSAYAPIVFQANFSLGIAVFQEVLRMITPMLKDAYDIEVVETHHNQKQDAPSGTAKMLVDVLNNTKEFEEVHGRNGMIGKRGKEIGIHAIRGGTVAGEHTVYFLGEDESFEIKHTATSKQIFVNGALRAAQYVSNKQPGSYTMKDILFDQ